MDPERLKEFAKTVFGALGGATTSAMIHLGDRLGQVDHLRPEYSPPAVRQQFARHRRGAVHLSQASGRGDTCSRQEDTGDRLQRNAEGTEALRRGGLPA